MEAFSFVEYLSIFTSIVYGYAATRFLSGWSAIINFREQLFISKAHLAWTLLTFGLLIDVWWGSWMKGSQISRHVALYYLSLVSPLIFYIISVMLFPPLVGSAFFNLRAYF